MVSELCELESSEKRNLSELFWNWISEKLKPGGEIKRHSKNFKQKFMIKLASV